MMIKWRAVGGERAGGWAAGRRAAPPCASGLMLKSSFDMVGAARSGREAEEREAAAAASMLEL